MKIARVTCFLLVLLLSLVAFAFPTSAPRAHAASGTTFVFRFHGMAAQADFDNVSPDGCIDTFVFVDGSQNTVNNQTVSSADVFIGQFDLCPNTQMLAASGTTFNPTFQIDSKLLSARLNTTTSVFHQDPGKTFNLSANLAWTS